MLWIKTTTNIFEINKIEYLVSSPNIPKILFIIFLLSTFPLIAEDNTSPIFKSGNESFVYACPSFINEEIFNASIWDEIISSVAYDLFDINNRIKKNAIIIFFIILFFFLLCKSLLNFKILNFTFMVIFEVLILKELLLLV